MFSLKSREIFFKKCYLSGGELNTRNFVKRSSLSRSVMPTGYLPGEGQCEKTELGYEVAF